FLPVNVESLAELADPAQQHWRQASAPAAQEQLQRRQIQLTIDTLRRMAHNAALLQKLGYCQLHSPNQLISSLAQEMIDAGVHVRLYTFVGLIALQVRLRLPLSVPLASARKLCDVQDLLASSLIPAYEQLKDKAANLTCLKFSSLHEELAQSL